MSTATTGRREFLANASRLACAPLFFPGLSLQTPKPERPRNLVLIELFGGVDSLSILVPRDDDDYFRARPTLAVRPQDLLSFDDDRGFPPTVAPLHEMWHEGLVRIVEGVGYPNSLMSHFAARVIWGAAMPNHTSVANGWVARMRRQLWNEDPNPEVLTHVGSVIPPSMNAPNLPVLCFERPRDMEWIASCGGGTDAKRATGETDKDSQEAAPDILDQLRGTLSISQRLGPRLQTLTAAYKPNAPFPATPFGSHLQTVAGLIQGGFGSRVYSLRHGDFDMHTSDPKNTVRPQVEFAAGIQAFLRNLKGTSAYEDTLVLCHSEFGRRPKENSAGGCDHGAAGTMFLFGGKLRGGISGQAPSLKALDENGNLSHSMNFRSVYAAVIEQWFKAEHQPIMLERLPVPELI